MYDDSKLYDSGTDVTAQVSEAQNSGTKIRLFVTQTGEVITEIERQPVTQGFQVLVVPVVPFDEATLMAARQLFKEEHPGSDWEVVVTPVKRDYLDRACRM